MPEEKAVPIGQVLILREEFADIARGANPPLLAKYAAELRARRLVAMIDELIAYREEEAARMEVLIG